MMGWILGHPCVPERIRRRIKFLRACTRDSFGVFVYRGQVSQTRNFFHFHTHPPQIADAVGIYSADDGLPLL